MRSVLFRKFGPSTTIIVLTALTALGLFWGSNHLFALTAIEVDTTGVQVIIDEKKLPKNLLFFPSERVRESILQDNPLVASLELTKHFPHTLVIAAIPRVPVARIRLESSIGLIDANGYIVGIGEGESLPLIWVEPIKAAIGQKVDNEGVRASLVLITSLPKEFIVQKITRYDSSSVQGEMGKTNIVIAQNVDHVSLSGTLQTILEGFRIRGTMPTLIDLRYDKPVVRF